MSDNNIKAIESLIEKWALAVRNGDVSTILFYHDKDIVVFDVPFATPSTGLDAYKKTWELYASKGAYEINDMRIIASDNMAYCYGVMKCSSNDTNELVAGTTFRLTACLVKKNKHWLICHEHHSLVPECIN